MDFFNFHYLINDLLANVESRAVMMLFVMIAFALVYVTCVVAIHYYNKYH